jgi:hypothetical protein
VKEGIGDYEDEATGCPHDGHPYFKGWFRTEDRENNSECFMWQEVILKFIKKNYGMQTLIFLVATLKFKWKN